MLAITPFNLLCLPLEVIKIQFLKLEGDQVKLGPKSFMHKSNNIFVANSSQDYFDLMSTISKTIPVEQVHSIYFHLTTRSLGRHSTCFTYTP